MQIKIESKTLYAKFIYSIEYLLNGRKLTIKELRAITQFVKAYGINLSNRTSKLIGFERARTKTGKYSKRKRNK